MFRQPLTEDMEKETPGIVDTSNLSILLDEVTRSKPKSFCLFAEDINSGNMNNSNEQTSNFKLFSDDNSQNNEVLTEETYQSKQTGKVCDQINKQQFKIFCDDESPKNEKTAYHDSLVRESVNLDNLSHSNKQSSSFKTFCNGSLQHNQGSCIQFPKDEVLTTEITQSKNSKKLFSENLICHSVKPQINVSGSSIKSPACLKVKKVLIFII